MCLTGKPGAILYTRAMGLAFRPHVEFKRGSELEVCSALPSSSQRAQAPVLVVSAKANGGHGQPSFSPSLTKAVDPIT
jgi:hypothetical protein